MNYDNFTKLARRALKQGGQIARIQNHQNIENGHILKGIFDTDRNITPFLIKRMDADPVDLEDNIDKIISTYLNLYNGNATISSYVEKGLKAAQSFAKRLNDNYISVEHILLGIVSANDAVSTLLKNKGITEQKILIAIQELRKGVSSDAYETPLSSIFRDYAVDLTAIANDNQLPLVVERDAEIKQIIEIIARRKKHFALLVGKKGIGKTSIAIGLAQRIVNDEIPAFLKKSSVLKIKLFDFLNETRESGLAIRLNEILDDAEDAKNNHIVFIDDMELLLQNADDETLLHIFSILESISLRNSLMIVVTTTTEGFETYFNSQSLLNELFTPIFVNQPSDEELRKILLSAKTDMEVHHAIRISKSAIDAAIMLSKGYSTDSNPGVAIDLLDRAASRLAISIHSLPQYIVDIEEEIRELNIKKLSSKDEKELNEIQESLLEISDEKNKQRAIWESVRELINEIAKTKQHIIKLNIEMKTVASEDNYDKLMRIKTAKIPEAKEQLKKLKEELAETYTNRMPFKDELDDEAVAAIVHQDTGISLKVLLQDEREKIALMESALHRVLVGKSEAVRAIAYAFKRHNSGMESKSNKAMSFLLLGTAGSGKVQIAKELAKYIYTSEWKVKVVNAAEQTSVEILNDTQNIYSIRNWIDNNPHPVVVFRDIDKADNTFLLHLANAIENGTIGMGNRKTDIRNTIFIFTSVIVASKELNKRFPMSFIRLHDGMATIATPSENTLAEIAALKISNLRYKLSKQTINLMVTPLIAKFVAAKAHHPKLGALLVDNVITKYVENKIADAIVKGEVNRENIVFVAFEDGVVEVKNVDDDIAQRLMVAGEKLSISPVGVDKEDVDLFGGDTSEPEIPKKSFFDKLRK